MLHQSVSIHIITKLSDCNKVYEAYVFKDHNPVSSTSIYQKFRVSSKYDRVIHKNSEVLSPHVKIVSNE